MTHSPDTPETRLIAGCMSGTSLDGLDAALVAITGHGLDMRANFIGMISRPLGDLRDELRHFASGGAAEPIRYLRAARRLGELHADAVAALCEQEGCKQLDFVVAHGQTIWHAPGEGMSWQLFDPWPLVRRLKVPVCYDLRQADLIAGGQGAPITPLADSILYRSDDPVRVIVNLGGIVNGTSLYGDPALTTGQDVGPGNLLIDGIVHALFPHLRFDKDGEIAGMGEVQDRLVKEVKAQPFFQHKGGPRSTGREEFSDAWVHQLAHMLWKEDEGQEDIVRSAVYAVASIVADWLIGEIPYRAVLAGGGARNPALVRDIRALSKLGDALLLSDDLGIPCEAREAMGFAVLGALSQDGVPITLPQVTGAKEPGRAGAWVYP